MDRITKQEIENLPKDQLLDVATDLGIEVNLIIWESLMAAGFYEGNPNPEIPIEYKYQFEKIKNMRRDTAQFLDFFELWPKIRQIVIDKLPAETPPVTLVIPTEPTVPKKSAYGWIEEIPGLEKFMFGEISGVSGDIVALLNILSGNIPITMGNIENLLVTYDYDRILKICKLIYRVEHNKYYIKQIPEITLGKLEQIYSILCTSEDFWKLKCEYDFGVIEKPEDISWRTQYTLTSILRSEDYAEAKWWEISQRKDLSIGVLEATMNDPRFKWDWFYLLRKSNLVPYEVAYFWFTHNPEKVKNYEWPPWFDMPIGGMTGNPDNPGSPGYGYKWWRKNRPKTSKLQELVDVYKISTLRTTRNRPVYTPVELRKILKELGLSTKGNKEILVYRLLDPISEDPVLDADMRYFEIYDHLDYERAGISRYTDGRWK